MEDGKFWFNELIRESFNFDEEVLWPNIESILNKEGFAELGIPSESEVTAFVKRETDGLNQYKLDLQALEDKKKREAEVQSIVLEERLPIRSLDPPGRTSLVRKSLPKVDCPFLTVGHTSRDK